MSGSKLIKVHSDHDASHVNHSLFRFNLGQYEIATHRVKSIVLVAAVVPNKHYNVNSNNNVLRYDTGGAVASIVVPVGQYSTTTLIAYLQSQLAGSTWTQSTLNYLINVASAGVLNLYSVDTDPLSTLAPYLGLNTDVALNISASDFENMPDLNGMDMFLIESQTLASNNMISSLSTGAVSSKNVIACIPIDVTWGANQTYEYNGSEDSRVTFTDPRNITNIDIKITDQHHNSLSLQSPSTFIFRVYY